ncbi:protein ADM2a [Lampris incognitus]|uniref:protein ADM2a n=1 Tax=Lampris incognitus TaxID=2546036 RepID=UPI0024B4DF4B|nr:protein ADM2a [Lampris incognitus]
MRSLLPLAAYCISLLCLQQLSALPAGRRVEKNRSDLLQMLTGQTNDKSITPASQRSAASSSDAPPTSSPQPSTKQPPGFLRHAALTKLRATLPSLVWARPTEQDPESQQRSLRGRRHAHSGSRGGHHQSHHAQLMRVGCVLGTCQVQNLSHRLYQLIGQSGREDSSPINPRSPHSYG